MPDLYLSGSLHLHVGSAPAPNDAAPKAAPTHHLAVVDCSGSMAGELPLLVAQLKNKLPSLLDPGDFFSIVWFSGRNEAGVVLDHASVRGLQDLDKLQKTLEKWLKPVGMTGFVKPAQIARDLFLLDRTGTRKNLLFLSDGCENQSSKAEVFSAFQALGREVSAATVVEYGYYADRAMLGKLAELSGGSIVLSRDFPSYDVVFERALSAGPREKFVDVQIALAPEGDVVFVLDDRQRTVRVFRTDTAGAATTATSVSLPEGCSYAFLYNKPSDTSFAVSSDTPTATAALYAATAATAALYAALAVFGHRMKGGLVRQILQFLGDVALIEQFSGCFGKQRYADFVETATAIAFEGTTGRTFDANAVPEESAFTVPDLLTLLLSDPSSRLLLDNPLFQYARMSRGRQDVSATKLVFEKAVTADGAADTGVPLLALTWNEERPNVSVLVERFGTVDLSVPLRDAPQFRGRLPEKFPTRIFRNYNLVRDGIVHVDLLPVGVSEAVFNRLKKAAPKILRGCSRVEGGRMEVVLDVSGLPVTNWAAVKEVSAREFFLREYALHAARSWQKVLKVLLDEVDPGARQEGKREALSKLYGDEAAAWLKTLGLTDHGYAPPKTAQVETKDVYTAKFLIVRMKGLSSIPSVKEVREQREKNRVKNAGYEMAVCLAHFDEFMEATRGMNAAGKKDAGEALLARLDAAQREVRRLIVEQAKTRFTIITGQVWFAEFSSLDLDDSTMTLGASGDGLPFDVEFSAELVEKDIPV